MNTQEMNTNPVDQPILAHEETLDRLKGDQEFLKTLYGVFADDLPKKLAAIEEAMAGHDNDSLQRTAHSLKGASATVGAIALKEDAMEMELAAKNNESGKIEDLIAKLKETARITLESVGERIAG